MRCQCASVVTLFFVGYLPAALGCTGVEEFPLGQVSGTVTCEGQPVTKAIVYFEPVRSGKSAHIGQQGFGLTDESGKFTISTYGESDGAVVGKHLVRVGRSESSPACPCALIADNVLQEVEVKNGPNDFDLSLAKATAADRRMEKQIEQQMDD